MARRLALQTLFEIDSVGHLAGNVVDARLANPEPNEEGEDPAVVVSQETAAYLRFLVAGVLTHLELLDAIIARYAPDWPVLQLAIIDRNLLRLALFELGSPLAKTPAKVVINEAVELAKSFGGTDGHKYVNGVLDRTAADLRPVEVAQARAQRRP